VRLRLFEPFAPGVPARAAVERVGVNRNAVNRFYLALRIIIAGAMEKAAPLHGEVEVDESYSAAGARERWGEAPTGKCLSLVC